MGRHLPWRPYALPRRQHTVQQNIAHGFRGGSAISLNINTLAENTSGLIWLGTNGNGVVIIDAGGVVTATLRHSADGDPTAQICGNSVHAIAFDRAGDAWIGTSDAGLSHRRADGTFEQYNLASRRLNNNCVYAITEDNAGRIWVGTATGLVAISAGKTQVFAADAGIAEEPVYAIAKDNDNNLWLSTPQGIMQFSISKGEVVRTVSPQRLQCREFKRGAAFADDDGMLYFGGVGGVVSFAPSVFDTARAPKAVDIHYISYSDAEGNPVCRPITHDQSIDLDYTSNTFSIEFGAFEYCTPEEVVYSTLLQGYNREWQAVPAGAQTATFANIPYGHYTLRVRAAMGEGTTECSIPLVVRPPLLLTPVAKILYCLILVSMIFGIIVLARAKARRRADEQRRSHEDAMMEQKLQFFTDISHEVRTPLTLILSPLATLRAATKDRRTLATYDMMESNGRRILRMVDQVIDLRKFDHGRMELHTAPVEVRTFLANIAASFANIIDSRAINFHIGVDDAIPTIVNLDSDKIDKVVFNVLANAFRFTPDGGTVALNADIDGTGALRIRISDTGPGVPQEYREAIFNRFYQVKSERMRGGTGIGLHLSLKMMEAHHGRIFVEESSAAGSTFAIIIPLEAIAAGNDDTAAAYTPDLQRAICEPSVSLPFPVAPKAHSVLIVEDDAAIGAYLATELRSEYNVSIAADGAEGLEEALRLRPHCIVTDLMMQGMDGLEMIRKIRGNDAICEIPIIAVTARASEEQRIEGLEAGADAYIPKPFNIEHLRTRIAMLIHSRRVIKQKFSGAVPVNTEVAAMKSSDDKLLEKVEAVVLDELANSDLSVEFIADRIGVSRSHLHRRLKVLTNVSPGTYIKQARMRHASLLLVEKGMSVSEVAYATGFSSLSHFSTVFKDYYGMAPSRYVAINNKT